MTWSVVALKDFRDARRSKALWALAVVFLLFTVGMVFLYSQLQSLGGDGGQATSIGLLAFVASPASLFVSITSVVVCYKSVAGEAETGTGKLLLSLPNDRLDVVVGKVAGRAAVLAIPLLAGFLVALVAAVGLFDNFDPLRYLWFVAVTLVFTVAYVGLVVGISASTTSTSRASAMAVGAWLVLEILWDVVPIGAVFVTNGFSLPTEMPEWALFLSNLAPSAAYGNAATDTIAQSGMLAGETPLYLQSWFSLLVLVAWAVIPVTLGYLRYRDLDL